LVGPGPTEPRDCVAKPRESGVTAGRLRGGGWRRPTTETLPKKVLAGEAFRD
jgi:hypothetical protein